MEADAENLRRIFDTLQSKAALLESELRELDDQIEVTEIMGAQPQLEDNDQLRKIRHMENKLDTVSIKLTDENIVKEQYENSIATLQEADKDINAKLSFLEKTSLTRQHDLDQVVMLSKEAIHAQESAYLELERRRANFASDQKTREKIVAEKVQTLHQRKLHFDRWKERESMRAQLEESEKLEKEMRRCNDLRDRAMTVAKLDVANRLESFEDSFRSIKKVTGVSNVNDVISKFQEQMIRTAELSRASKENQEAIEDLQCQYRQAKDELEQAVWASAGDDISRRHELLRELHRSAADGEAMKNARERFDKLSRCVALLQTGLSDALCRLNEDEDEVAELEVFSDLPVAAPNDTHDSTALVAVSSDCRSDSQSAESELETLLRALERRLAYLMESSEAVLVSRTDARVSFNTDEDADADADHTSLESPSPMTSVLQSSYPLSMATTTDNDRPRHDGGNGTNRTDDATLLAARRNVKKASADLVRRMEHKQILEQRRLAREQIRVPSKPTVSI